MILAKNPEKLLAGAAAAAVIHCARLRLRAARPRGKTSLHFSGRKEEPLPAAIRPIIGTEADVTREHMAFSTSDYDF